MARAAGSTDRGPSPAVGELGGRVAAATLEEEEGDPWRDWAGGVPQEVLAMIGEALVAQKEAAWAARLTRNNYNEGYINERLEERKSEGRCLYVFARVCKEWRKAQLKVGGPLRTRVYSDVILPGRAELVEWALAEGCPREGDGYYTTMAHYAAEYGHLELVQSLCGEEGASWGFARFAMDENVMMHAARSGNLELVKWLRANGCPWDAHACHVAVRRGHVRVLRWARENGCKWTAATRDRAAGKLGYTDDLGNAVDNLGNAVQ